MTLSLKHSCMEVTINLLLESIGEFPFFINNYHESKCLCNLHSILYILLDHLSIQIVPAEMGVRATLGCPDPISAGTIPCPQFFSWGAWKWGSDEVHLEKWGSY